MALLVELGINGDTLRVSNEVADLTHFWDPYISSAGSIKWSMPEPYGGHVKTVFSNFTLLPKTFEENWPPPNSIDVRIRYTDSDELSAVTLFGGKGHVAGIDRESNEYELFGEEIDKTVTDQSFNDTLVNIFTTYTGASYLNLTLDTSAARSPSPAVNYTASGTNQILDVLSDIAKFFSHAFYIDTENSKLYLVDMLANNGASTLTEFDFKPVQYRDPTPISKITGGNYYVSGTAPYGSVIDISPVCHGTQANIEAALANILTIIESRGAEVTIPIATGLIPVIGEAISWTDESYDQNISMSIRTAGIIYDFDQYEFTIEGRGSIS